MSAPPSVERLTRIALDDPAASTPPLNESEL